MASASLNERIQSLSQGSLKKMYRVSLKGFEVSFGQVWSCYRDLDPRQGEHTQFVGTIRAITGTCWGLLGPVKSSESFQARLRRSLGTLEVLF